jgi:ubiquinone/menaquinone biosynthesis C-methylase UbiE
MTEWDEYWSEKSTHSKRIYDVIAVVYRAIIIKPNLRKYLKLYFKGGDKLLHAGCGGGGVEHREATRNPMRIVAFDISNNALKEYRTRHKWTPLVQGTILDLGFKDNTFDGIYNLGVMEHFNDEEINKILLEFNRVLKKKGVALLFWAHKMGITVIFLKYVHYILNTILKRDIQLHPAEPSLVKSREWLEERIKGTNFKIIRVDFNLSNLYTYMIVVIIKDD